MGWDGMEWHGTGWHGVRWDTMGWDGMGGVATKAMRVWMTWSAVGTCRSSSQGVQGLGGEGGNGVGNVWMLGTCRSPSLASASHQHASWLSTAEVGTPVGMGPGWVCDVLTCLCNRQEHV